MMRRRKLPWRLHPCGKLYTEVQGNSRPSFGQKMMEKMGWTKGKGLGRNEDGNVQHIKVLYKNDNKGVGFSGDDGNWLGNQCDFDSLLADLQNEYKNIGTSVNPTNLAVKSKLSKRRVHYHKMIQGKDLSMRSKEDLECVLGNNHKRLLTPDCQTEIVEETTLHNVDHMFTSKDSIDSYFAKRKAELKNGLVKAILEPVKRKKKKKRKKEILCSDHILEDQLLIAENSNTNPTTPVFDKSEDVCYDHCEEERTGVEFGKRNKRKKKKLKERSPNEWVVEPMFETDLNGDEESTKMNQEIAKAETYEEDGVQHRKRKKRKTDAELKENCPSDTRWEKVGSKKQRRLMRKHKFKTENLETESATLTAYHTISICQPDSTGNLKETSRRKKRKLGLDDYEESGERPVKRVRFCEEVTVHTVAMHDEVRGGALREFLGLLKNKR